GWIGITFLYRFNGMGEPFPDFLTPSDFSERPLLRQVTNYKKCVDYNTEYDSHKKLFDLIGFTSKSITHLGRGSGQRSMFAAGIQYADIQTLTRYIHSSQSENYIVNVPLTCMVHGGGGHPSPNGQRAFSPARSRLGGIDSDIMDRICPYLRQVCEESTA
ncbi:MAG: hypothetical protein ACREBR_02025, partial [bacterium]